MKQERKINIIYSVIPILFIFFGIALVMIVSNFNTKYYETVSRKNDILSYNKKEADKYDTVGWLRIQGTNIDYPILHTFSREENRYPLSKENYVWITSSDGKFNNYTNIDGHNLFSLGDNIEKHSKDFKRFEELMDFIYYDFAKENLYFQISTKDGDYLYKIFAVNLFTYEDSYSSKDDGYDNKEEFQKYIDLLKSNSIYDYSIDVDNTDKIVSLRTCSRFFKNEDSSRDFIVSGRLIREKEKISSYLVNKNKNYKAVESALNGVDNNEENI